jgi:hypothetical protein
MGRPPPVFPQHSPKGGRAIDPHLLMVKPFVEQGNQESLMWLVAVALLVLICYGMYRLAS